MVLAAYGMLAEASTQGRLVPAGSQHRHAWDPTPTQRGCRLSPAMAPEGPSPCQLAADHGACQDVRGLQQSQQHTYTHIRDGHHSQLERCTAARRSTAGAALHAAFSAQGAALLQRTVHVAAPAVLLMQRQQQAAAVLRVGLLTASCCGDHPKTHAAQLPASPSLSGWSPQGGSPLQAGSTTNTASSI
jgi:hypothetical protein